MARKMLRVGDAPTLYVRKDEIRLMIVEGASVRVKYRSAADETIINFADAASAESWLEIAVAAIEEINQ
jgi:hypothetical protein